MVRLFGPRAFWRSVSTAFILAAFAGTWWLSQNTAYAGSGSRLYVLLGFANMSPGLSEFGAKVAKRGIPTIVGSHLAWPGLAQQAIDDYKSGRLRSIMIVGHSLGGSAGRAMAAELNGAKVPVRLLVTIDPVGDGTAPANVRRSINIVPKDGEDHYSVISARMRDLTGYVLGR